MAGASVAVLALGWWFYRPRQTSSQTDQSAALPDTAPGLTGPSAPGATDDPYRTAGYDTLLNLLRQKLSGSGGEVQAALAEIAKSRPELAIALAHELGRTNAEKALWVQGIVGNWAQRDPKNAWDWLTQPTNQLANNSMVSAVMDAMAVSDPEMLLGNLDALLLKNDTSGGLFSAQNSMFLGLMALVKSNNTDLARAAVEAWANDPLKLKIGAGAFEMVAMAMVKTAPDATATWLESLPSSDDRNAAIGTFAVSWGQSDPTAAMRWAETLSPKDGQSEAVGRVFLQWMQNDAAAAMNWLDDYVPRTSGIGEDDVLIGSMILFSPTTKNDPNEALKLADSIDNPQTRLIYQEEVCQSWGRTDPGSAVEFVLNSQTIPPDQKQMLIQQIQDANKAVLSPNQPEQ